MPLGKWQKNESFCVFNANFLINIVKDFSAFFTLLVIKKVIRLCPSLEWSKVG